MNFGRYRVIEEIGHGNVGVVYRAHDPVIGRSVAVKVVRDFAWLTPDQREAFVARFRAEAEAAGALHHPNVVHLYDIGEGYLVMEFVEGQTLASLLRARQRLPLGQVLEMAGQVADALDYAHGKGIVHRGLKPANIMVLPTGGVKVMDFGVARPRTRGTDGEQRLLGSAAYMAPEQLLFQRAEAPADVFSLGVVLFELLTGERPFAGNSEAAIIEQIKSAPPVPLIKLNPALPLAYEPVLLKAMEKDPARRQQTAGQLVAALREASPPDPDALVSAGAGGAGGPAAVVSLPSPLALLGKLPPWLRSRAVLAGAVGLLIVVALLGWILSRRAPTSASAPTPPPSPASAPSSAAMASAPAPSDAATPQPSPAGKTVLLVNTRPTGGRIFVGGVEKGLAPLTLMDPDTGPVVVRAEREGHHPAARLAIITPGQSVGLSIVLPSLGATPTSVDVLSMPDGGVLAVDGEVVGRTNAGLQLPPGTHVVEVRKEGFVPYYEEIEVGSQGKRVIAHLEKELPPRPR